MKARFYVTVEVPTPKSQLEKVKAKEARAEAIAFIEERVNADMADLNPTDLKVRISRK
jgi:hypothetical protein